MTDHGEESQEQQVEDLDVPDEESVDVKGGLTIKQGSSFNPKESPRVKWELSELDA